MVLYAQGLGQRPAHGRGSINKYCWNVWPPVCPVFPSRYLVRGLSHNRHLWEEWKFMTSYHLKVKCVFSTACGTQHVLDSSISPTAAACTYHVISHGRVFLHDAPLPAKSQLPRSPSFATITLNAQLIGCPLSFHKALSMSITEFLILACSALFLNHLCLP